MREWLGTAEAEQGGDGTNWFWLVWTTQLIFRTDRLPEAATWVVVVLLPIGGGGGACIPFCCTVQINPTMHQHSVSLKSG